MPSLNAAALIHQYKMVLSENKNMKGETGLYSKTLKKV